MAPITKRSWSKVMSVRDIREDVVGFEEIHALLLDPAGREVAHLDAFVAVSQNDDVADVDEEPVLDDARDLVDHQRELAGVADASEMQVEDEIALVGPERLIPVHAPRHLVGEHVERGQRLLYEHLRRGPAERYDLDRQRERSERG